MGEEPEDTRPERAVSRSAADKVGFSEDHCQ